MINKKCAIIWITVIMTIMIGIVKVSPLHRDAKEICNWYDETEIFHVGNDSINNRYNDYKEHEVFYRAYALDWRWFIKL